MSATVIIDYGMGNLRSVQKACEKAGDSAVVSSDPAVMSSAERLILPGVGAFRDAVAALQQHDLIPVIRDFIAADRPFLGICLGMQLLMDVSFEGGEYEGLGIIPGRVRRFDLPSGFKIPHMGWNQLMQTEAGRQCALLRGVSAEAWYYFVHSYYVEPLDESWVAARTDYGIPFVSVVARGRVMATQFHPEKSQNAGQQLLRNFLAIPVKEAAVGHECGL